ncbi:hypothetical protein G6F50_014433 [Rhizopus delemar]|uniref:Uncharacterized protein n=1 Tax=Rhizopus delemar TaxID=936053 RepID=A0A9P7C896_9FUNG|nr:hypothetical protein G6F50_014433 [Rhizopus delemar]
MPRHRRPLRIVQAGVTQRAAFNIEVVQARLAVDTPPEHDGAAIIDPRPAPLLGRFVGQLLRDAATGRHPPQVAHLRITHEHQPLAVRRVARRIVEVVRIDAVVQGIPLTTGQVQHPDAAMRIPPDHAAEYQPTAVGGPVETEQFGAVTASPGSRLRH